MLKKKKTALLFPGTAATKVYMPINRYVFSIMSTYEAEGRFHADYIATCVDDPKVMINYADAEIGKEYMKGLKAQLKHYGISVVGEMNHKFGTVDFSSHALKAQKSGANVVAIYSITGPTAKFAIECKKIGYKPLFIMGASESTSETLHLGGKAIEGAIGTQIGALQISRHPVVKKYNELLKKHRPGKHTRNVELYGFAYLRTAVEGFRRAGRNLNRETLITSLETFKRYDTGVFGPVTYTPTRRIGADSIIMHTNRGGSYKYYVPGWHTYKRF